VYEAPVQQRALKGTECRSVVADVRAGLAHYGVTVNPTSDLARICKELEWLAHDLDSGAVSDRKRHNATFPLIDQASRIASALVAIRQVEGAREKVRHLRKQVDRLETQAAGSQDYLFEIEVAGRLVAAGLRPAFAEPDIRVDVAGLGSVLIACKRPRSVTGFVDALADAASQIAASGGPPGLAIVSVEAVLQRPNDDASPIGDAYPTRAMLRDVLSHELMSLLYGQDRAVRDFLTRHGVNGLILWAVAGAKIMAGNSYAAEWHAILVPRPDEYSKHVTAAIASALKTER
jgi:hypothetical protein